MENIVDVLETRKAYNNPEYDRLLVEAGFKASSEELIPGYPLIPKESIKQLLVNYVNRMFPSKMTKRVSFGDFNFVSPSTLAFNRSYRFTGFALEFSKPAEDHSYGHSNIACWVESDIDTTIARPPIHVLNSIINAKSTFGLANIRIVTLSIADNPLKDPLVIGLKNNCGIINRHLIDWWDKDIDPTELIETPKVDNDIVR